MTTPGFGKCPECSGRVLLALAVTGDVIALDYDYDRVDTLAVDWDCTRTPRVREVGPSGHTRPSEHRYRMHRDACPALAPVSSLARARDLRVAATRTADHARRAASAR
jgi:hypothetical protein